MCHWFHLPQRLKQEINFLTAGNINARCATSEYLRSMLLWSAFTLQGVHYPTQKDKMQSTVIIASHRITENDINVSQIIIVPGKVGCCNNQSRPLQQSSFNILLSCIRNLLGLQGVSPNLEL
jgi:hypothetical protein